MTTYRAAEGAEAGGHINRREKLYLQMAKRRMKCLCKPRNALDIVSNMIA